jgi:hypothetical protein
MSAPAPNDDFLSGASGQVWGIRATSRAVLCDAICDLAALARLERWRLARAAQQTPPRRVLALGIEREGVPNLMAAARQELERSRHQVQFASAPAGDRGKFENLDLLLERHPAAGHDWLLVIDDDVALPSGFLDRFLFLAERFGLRLAQPAHRWRSHAAVDVTRRRPGSVVRETGFVEIGPVTALHSATFDELLPFPPLRAGWGLDAHWSALATQRGWPLGVVDATPILHGMRRTASAYDRDAAIAEGREFLAHRPYLSARESQRTVSAHRSWR